MEGSAVPTREDMEDRLIQTRLLRTLLVEPSQHPRRQAHVSSASGLVMIGPHACLVADDENHLVLLPRDGIESAPLDFLRLAEGELPADAAARKRLKRDLETLLVVPATSEAPALLVALGSGSTPQRDFAYVLVLDASGVPQGHARRVSLTALYDLLRAALGEINIEAGLVQDDHLMLVHRAHAGDPSNALVTIAMRDMHALLHGAPPATALAPVIVPLALGELDGVPLGITDAARAADGGWVFSAVAEATDNAYDDGACVGSVLGQFDAEGRLVRMQRIEGGPKVEGVAFASDTELWLATDADDPAKPSAMYSVAWN